MGKPPKKRILATNTPQPRLYIMPKPWNQHDGHTYKPHALTHTQKVST